MRQTLLPACLAFATVVGGAGAGRAEVGGDEPFLAGLRERFLFELAEHYCTRRLEDAKLPESQRAVLVVELSLTLADWAANSAPDRRDRLWQRAWEVTETFAREHPHCPLLPLVRFQGALSLLARGELSRQEAEVLAGNEELLAQARASLAAAIRALEQLSDDVSQELRDRNLPGRAAPARSDPEPLPTYRLLALRDNLQYQLARAYRNQGQCHAPDGPDWVDALTLAVQTLDPLARLEPIHPVAWTSRVDEIVCHRLLKDGATARQKLDALEAENPPPSIALRLRAERLRLALAADRLDEAIERLALGREIDGATSADLDYAMLETCLAAWSAASQSGDNDKADLWRDKTSEMVRLIGRVDGPYWTRRAQMLVSSAMGALPGAGLSVQIQAAENAYHSGQYDEALAAYDRARELARQQGDAAQAFDLGFIAATIEHRRNRHEEAQRRYRALAQAAPERPRAAEAHLLAFYHAGRSAAAQPEGALERYLALGEEHLRNWPNGPTADEVRWCLGRTRQHRRDWRGAVEQYRDVSPQYAKFEQVVEAIDECYAKWIDAQRQQGQPTADIAEAAAAWFESLLLGARGRLPERWGPLERGLALSAARFRIDLGGAGVDRAEEILSAALEAAGDAPAEWRSAATILRICALAGLGRHDEAASLLDQTTAGSPGPLLQALGALSRLAADHPARAELARLQLKAVELLGPRRDELDASAQRDLDRLTAAALADAGRLDESLEAYRWLAKTYPHDGDVQEAYAQLLMTRGDRPSLEAALAKWREIDKKSRRGTDRWFRAKYSLTWLHCRLGDRQRAGEILRLLEVLYPELGGPAMKPRFEALLEELGLRPQADAR